MFAYVNKRQRGLPQTIGFEDRIHRSIYGTFTQFDSWHSSENRISQFGGVYNMEFSPDGSLMVAACEKKAIVLFDPVTNKQTLAVRYAHQDSVNCVKFLSNSIFATCSDDSTVALWDKRNLSTKLRSLHGHMNWVKNIEYSNRESLLVTSGFDGSIFTWDVNATTEQGFVYKKVFHTPGLMRCRLSPDAKQLVICTTGGYLIIIHDVDLHTLAEDLNGFKPNVYRLMQLGRQFIPNAAKYEHVFSKNMKRNRVELVSDFPNDAEVISSLQIHPQGWCALSRNISYDESSEYTCLHDIQERDLDENSDDSDNESETRQKKFSALDDLLGSSRSRRPNVRSISQNRAGRLNRTIRPSGARVSLVRNVPTVSTRSNGSNAPSGSRRSNVASSSNSSSNTSRGSNASRRHDQLSESELAIEPEDLMEGIASVGRRPHAQPATARRTAGTSTHSPQMDIWAAEVTLRDRLLGVRQNDRNTFANTHVYGINSGVFGMPQEAILNHNRPSDPSEPSEPSEPPTARQSQSPTICDGNRFTYLPKRNIPQNTERMLYYAEQPNKGQGLIKEECFSSCGRMVCSPFGFGFRLMAYTNECSELPRALEGHKAARDMVEISRIIEHNDVVVSTRFSPTQPLLASGCLQGRIHWHYPHI